MGQKVTYEFLKSLSQGYPLNDALEKAKAIAQEDGSLLPFQISFILNLLNILGPTIIKFFSDFKNKETDYFTYIGH